MQMPKRVSDRLARAIGKFQQVLKNAKDRDVNEADTVSIVKDMLSEVFGYDKYLDVTSEFAVRSIYCDLAVKIDGKVEYLIEAKAIGLDLKEAHLRQVVEYGSTHGIQWVILTTGAIWQVYRIRFEQPVTYDLVCVFDFAELNPKSEEHQEKLFVVCKEGLVKEAREELHEKALAVNRFMLGALLLSEEMAAILRRELRKLSEGVAVTTEEIQALLAGEVLKRDVLEGDEADKAQGRVRRFYNKARRPKEVPVEKPGDTAQAQPLPDASRVPAPPANEPITTGAEG